MSAKYESLKSAVEASEAAWKNVESKREEFIRAVNALTGRFFDKDTSLRVVESALNSAKAAMQSKKRKFDDLVAVIETLDVDSTTDAAPEINDECSTTDECDPDSPVLTKIALPHSRGQEPANSMYQGLSQFV
jgi:phage-related tail protein